ncbi:MAG: hypothetical protein IT480_19280, partial [Gammaproteobacteria bacterium]|nr:hypothetical protein [Gammaproteobacteria bacterium]
MDKDEILNGPNKEGEWVEAQADPDDPNSTPENTYAYVRRYADGRVVTEYYRRGQAGGPYRTKTSMDAAQEKRFKEQQAAAAKPPEERNNNGRRERWNPQTQRWEDVGAAISTNTAPAPKSEAEQRAEAANAQTAEERSRNEAKLNAERDWHEQQGHGRYTHAEWEQKLDKDAAEARANGQQ